MRAVLVGILISFMVFNVAAGAYTYAPLTGEALFKSQLQALAVVENIIAQVDQSINATKGSFLDTVQSLANDNSVLFRVLNGSITLTGPQCLMATIQISTDVAIALMHATDVITGDTSTGDLKYQSILQRLGMTLGAVLQAATDNAGVANAGPFLQVIQHINDDIALTTDVVNSQDMGAKCLTAIRGLGTDFVNILASLQQ